MNYIQSLRSLLRYLYSANEIECAWIFGSFAEGTSDESSDLDVAVVRRSGDRVKNEKGKWELNGRPLDLVEVPASKLASSLSFTTLGLHSVIVPIKGERKVRALSRLVKHRVVNGFLHELDSVFEPETRVEFPAYAPLAWYMLREARLMPWRSKKNLRRIPRSLLAARSQYELVLEEIGLERCSDGYWAYKTGSLEAGAFSPSLSSSLLRALKCSGFKSTLRYALGKASRTFRCLPYSLRIDVNSLLSHLLRVRD